MTDPVTAFDQSAFLDALDIPALGLLDPRRLAGHTHEGITSEADVLAVIRTKTPDQLLTALRAGAPNSGSMIDTIAEQELAEAFHHAFANNPNFMDYLSDRLGGDSSGLSGMLNDLDPRAVGPISDILVTIGNTPGYDMSLLDDVIDTTTNLNRLKALRAAETNAAEQARLDDQIQEELLEQLDAVQAAGGNVPALARLSAVDGAMWMQFLSDMTNPSGGTDFAISNLAAGIGLVGADLEAFQSAIGPFAGIIEFMIEPYAELYQNHGAALTNTFNNVQGTIHTLTTGNRVEIETGANVTVSFEAPATTVGINVATFGESFEAAMEGRTLGNLEDALDALEQASNGILSDEVALIEQALEDGIVSEVQVRAAFGMSASGEPPVSAEDLGQGMQEFVQTARAAATLQATFGG